MNTTISRKQLYERVWQQPISHIAREFGISDVGLRKACKRNGIPTPPAGYWAKVAHGKRVTQIKLPQLDEDYPIRIWRGGGEEPDAVAKARADALAAVAQEPEVLTENPAIERTFARLRAAKPGNDGLVRSKGPKLISVVVRPQCLERAEQLLRALFAAGAGTGLKLKVGTDAMAWHCGGENVSFELVEAPDQVEHVATEKELADHAKWQREREVTHKRFGYWSSYGEPKIPKWEDQYNGRLAIRLEKVCIKSERDPWGRAVRGTFADSRSRDVTRMIPTIVATIAAIAAAKVSNAAYEAKRREEDQKAKQRWQEEERRRYEWQRTGKLLGELMDIQSEVARLTAWLSQIRAAGRLAPRTSYLIDLAEQRLTQLQDELGMDAVERRLQRANLFPEAESVPR